MWSHSKHSKRSALPCARLESLVLQRTTALQSLSQRLLKVQDEERLRLARELHDSTGQRLFALKIRSAASEKTRARQVRIPHAGRHCSIGGRGTPRDPHDLISAPSAIASNRSASSPWQNYGKCLSDDEVYGTGKRVPSAG
jgi:Histidine kinase